MSGATEQQRAVPGQHNISKRRAEFFGRLHVASRSQLLDLHRRDFLDASCRYFIAITAAERFTCS